MSDGFDLNRFVQAQNPVYERVLAELRQGQKRSHWMWFIFPQFKGLGASFMSQKYAIRSLEEARAYLAHTALSARLRECVDLVNRVENRSIDEIFGYPDTMKFQSSLTLFAEAATDNEVFKRALDKYFAGAMDQNTLRLLGKRRAESD